MIPILSDFVAALDNAANAPPANGVQPCCRPVPVAPTIAIDRPKMVLVKKAYQTKAHRIKARLGTTRKFTGVGTLTSNRAAEIKIFDTAGNALALPLDTPGAVLSAGRTILIEGAAASSKMNEVQLTLTLSGGADPIIANPAQDQMTCVELQLDLCHFKPVPGGADPAPLSDADKIKPGRNLHLQVTELIAGRALLIVHQAKPADYPGNVVLTSIHGKVRTFAYANEQPAAHDAHNADPLSTANAKLDPPLKLWVEGAAKSAAPLDTGFTLEISDLKGQEGDRVTITVIRATFDVFQSRREPGKDPAVMKPADKLNPGRFVHIVSGTIFERPKVLIHRAEPATFAGNLELVVFDTTANSTAHPRLDLFTAEAPGGGALGHPDSFAHPSIPAAGLNRFVAGTVVSGLVGDTELRLRVSDAEGFADHAAFTVVQFLSIQAAVQPTPQLNAANQAAMHVPDPAVHMHVANSFSEDFAVNVPLVLMRNSEPNVTLVLTAQPPNIPIRWQAIRNSDDHASLGAPGSVPAVKGRANPLIADLNANNRGSFRIRPYIDCNGAKVFSAGEPSLPMNLILFDARVVTDRTAVNNAPADFQALIDGAGDVFIQNGTWAAGHEGITMDLDVIVTGGGANGRLGIDGTQRVFAGLIQVIPTLEIWANYATAGPPPVPHRYAWVIAANSGAATGNTSPDSVHHPGQPVFMPGHPAAPPAPAVPADPDPVALTFPILDSGQVHAGLGGNTAVMSHSKVVIDPANPAVGQKWKIQCADSPGGGFPAAHPGYPAAQIRGVHYRVDFRACFCFWTNVTGVEAAMHAAPVDAVANRLYTVVQIDTWQVQGDWTVAFPAAPAVPTLTATNPHTIKILNRQKIDPMGRAQDHNIEVRAPGAIRNVTLNAKP